MILIQKHLEFYDNTKRDKLVLNRTLFKFKEKKHVWVDAHQH